MGHVGPPLTHPCRDRPHSPPQTISGSTQPFCHNTLSGKTDREGLGEKPVPRVLKLENDALTTTFFYDSYMFHGSGTNRILVMGNTGSSPKPVRSSGGVLIRYVLLVFLWRRDAATTAASMQCRARANTPDARWYWLRSVLDLDDGGRQD